MAKGCVIFDKVTSEIKGYVRVGVDKDMELYPIDKTNHEKIEIPVDHPAFVNQRDWIVSNGALVQKPNV